MDPGATHTVCYCFGHSTESIADEIARTGRSTAVQSVTAEVKAGNCRCEVTNPKGTCCLADLRRAEQQALAVAAGGAVPGTGRMGRWAWSGTLAAAVLSSACCWLPLLLVTLGVSGLAVSQWFDRWRPWLVAVTFLMLGSAWWLLYRPRPLLPAGTDGSGSEACCAGAAGACAPGSGGVRRFHRRLLGFVTPLALAFVFFPEAAATLTGGGGDPVAAVEGQVMKHMQVEGMTCEGCAGLVRKALLEVPGVVQAEVDHASGEVSVVLVEGAEMSAGALRSAVVGAGYRVTSVE